ncbi:MAG: O-antigen ligase family protein [Bacteroidetes bacterium]|nr:MAG: O-antigen ligase family protein [Bacteroidota bacterium]
MREKSNTFPNLLLFLLFVIFVSSIILSFRAVTSISLGFIAVTGLIKNRIDNGNFFNRNLSNPFFISCCLLFALEIVSVVYSENRVHAWRNVWGKSLIIVVPFCLCCCDYIMETTRQKIMKWYCLVLFAACLFALMRAFSIYLTMHDASGFFYHRLVEPYSGHAIQFSILVFIALIYLLESEKNRQYILSDIFQKFLIIFLSVVLLLLSSKLVIVFYLGYFFYFILIIRKHKSKLIAIGFIAVFFALCVFVFGTNNPMSSRFRDIVNTDFSVLEKDKFDPGNYFNGLQFRLLQWKFVPQILNEKRAWATGVGVGDAQQMLNDKYVSENMYIGNAQRPGKGFLGYNTHNEFLQSLLETGIPGLLLYVVVCLSLIKMMAGKQRAPFIFISILLLAYSFSESVFESQYSSIIFLFFPLFFYLNERNDKR